MTIHEVITKYRRRWKHIDECRQAVDDFAKRLNAARRRLKLTYEQLAFDCEISPSRMYALCHGWVLPSFDELETLLSAVNLKGDLA